MIILMLTRVVRTVITRIARTVITGVAGLVTAGVARLVTGVARLVTAGVAGLMVARVARLVTAWVAGMRREAVIVAEAAVGRVALLGEVALLGPVARLRGVARLSCVVTATEVPTWVAWFPGIVIVLVPARARSWITETGPPVAWVRPRVVQVRVPVTAEASLRQAGAKVRRALLVIWVRLTVEPWVTGMIRVQVGIGGIAGIRGGLAAETAPFGVVAAGIVTIGWIRPAALVGR
jgi:hypothetical protein